MGVLPDGQCIDAIALVPGILGSELVDPTTKEVVWGLGAKQLASALLTGNIYDRLRDPNLIATRLLARTGSLPLLGRFEPYSKLTEQLRQLVADDAALLEYAYDWRQPVSVTAKQFATTASEHLQRWQRHRRGSNSARLVLVAHSMGGLICLDALSGPDPKLERTSVRQVITLGTPHLGSVKAVRALANGEVLPASWAIRPKTKQRLRALAIETPAVYDLLPHYPATYAPGSPHSRDALRRPTIDDFVAAGANRDLVADAVADFERRSRPAENVEIWAMLGVGQQTLQSFRKDNDGSTRFYNDLGGVDWAGDGTVHFHASYPAGGQVGVGLAQAHGALASAEEASIAITSRILGGTPGPWQGAGVGVHAPDSVSRGETFTVDTTMPRGVSIRCKWREAATQRDGNVELGPPQTSTLADGTTVDRRMGEHAWTDAGLYSVTVSGGGSSDVTVDVLVEHE